MRLVAEEDARDTVLLTVCNIAGGQFCPAGTKDILRSIELGTRLNLVPETDNKYDPCAVRIEYQGGKLGFIPGKSGADENRLIHRLMSLGAELVCIVRTKGDPEGHIAQMVTLGVYIQL